MSPTIQRPQSTIAGYVRVIVRSFEKMGLDGRALCEQADITYDSLTNKEIRIDQSNVTRLWQAAIDVTNDDSIALALSSHISLEAFHLLGYSLMSSLTLLDSCNRFIRYQRTVGELFDVQLHQDGEYYLMQFNFRCAETPTTIDHAPNPSIDAAIASLVGFTRWLIQDDHIAPSSISLVRNPPKNRERYTSTFGCEVMFSSDVNCVTFHQDILLRTIPTAHSEIALLNDTLIGKYLESIDRMCISDLVREKLTAMLHSGVPRSEDISAALNISNRTLHRRLKGEDTSFKVLLENTRKQLAVIYLANNSVSLKETAYLLGFSEPSNFYRAFKRWYGVPPGQHPNNNRRTSCHALRE